MNKLERFTVRLSQEDLKSLVNLAVELQRTKSDVVRFLIKEKSSSLIFAPDPGSKGAETNLGTQEASYG